MYADYVQETSVSMSGSGGWRGRGRGGWGGGGNFTYSALSLTDRGNDAIAGGNYSR